MIDLIETYMGPALSTEELFEKSSTADFAKTTGLLPGNIFRFAETSDGRHKAKTHFSLPFFDQAEALYCALGQLNCYEESVLNGILETPRHMLLSGPRAPLAYWNGVNTITGIVALTPPWLTAYAAKRLNISKGSRVCVLGYGYGYASIAFSHMVGEQGEIVAIELDEKLVEHGNKLLNYLHIDNVRLIYGNALDLPKGLGKFDAIWPTLSVKSVPYQWWEILADNGILAAFLPLTEAEFIGRRNQANNIASYNEYLSENWWLNLRLAFFEETGNTDVSKSTMYSLFNPPMESPNSPKLDVSHWYESTIESENKLLSLMYSIENVRKN